MRNFLKIFQKGPSVRRTDTNFPGGLIEKTCFFKKVLSVRQTSRTDFLSHRTDTNFPRNPYLVLEHIGIFQEGTPSRTDISLVGFGGCFRINSSLRTYYTIHWMHAISSCTLFPHFFLFPSHHMLLS